MKTPYIIGISSFAVHGTASLKNLISVLGEKILPVPSLLLNGLTNMSMVHKFQVPFRELLKSTFELAKGREMDLILYVGYLGESTHADIILEMIHEYRKSIQLIIVDPVSGDHGRAYVPNEVIDQWKKLIAIADIAFPNQTELKILTGHEPNVNIDYNDTAEIFCNLYPTTKLVVTGVPGDIDCFTGVAVFGDRPAKFVRPTLSKNFGGTGDLLVAHFIRNFFFDQMTFNQALEIAVDQTHQSIDSTIRSWSEDLLL